MPGRNPAEHTGEQGLLAIAEGPAPISILRKAAACPS